MNKDEILEKSKKENQSADPYTIEVHKKGFSLGVSSATIVSSILMLIRIFKENTVDLSIMAMIFVLNAVMYTYAAVKLKEKKTVGGAIIFDILAVAWVALAVIQTLWGLGNGR
ncbi:MAG: DUF6442 family protein [Ruminococcus sp.]|nr:DUF6442 family protein [Ruminococcus sp.]MCM1478843.1 DUF6442 family protein [Muribaculaceae bacterium]